MRIVNVFRAAATAAILLCIATAPVALASHTGWQYRLVGGAHANYGRLEVRRSSSYAWGTVCDDFFGDPDALVACRSLGYTTPIGYATVPVAYRGAVSQPTYFDNLACTGSESELASCSRASTENCAYTESIYLACRTTTTPPRFQYRLVGGTNSYGRLEVRPVTPSSAWGTVCDDYFGSNDAVVACRSLGLSTSPASYRTVRVSSEQGGSTSPIYMDDLWCLGTESTIADCMRPETHNCGHSEDVVLGCGVTSLPELSSATATAAPGGGGGSGGSGVGGTGSSEDGAEAEDEGSSCGFICIIIVVFAVIGAVSALAVGVVVAVVCRRRKAAEEEAARRRRLGVEDGSMRAETPPAPGAGESALVEVATEEAGKLAKTLSEWSLFQASTRSDGHAGDRTSAPACAEAPAPNAASPAAPAGAGQAAQGQGQGPNVPYGVAGMQQQQSGAIAPPLQPTASSANFGAPPPQQEPSQAQYPPAAVVGVPEFPGYAAAQWYYQQQQQQQHFHHYHQQHSQQQFAPYPPPGAEGAHNPFVSGHHQHHYGMMGHADPGYQYPLSRVSSGATFGARSTNQHPDDVSEARPDASGRRE